MSISAIRVLALGILKRRSLLMRSVVLVILCGALTQTGADGNGKGYQYDGKRTLDVLDYGYALPIEITAIRNLHERHWLRDLEVEIKNISTKPIYEVYIGLLLPDDRNDTGLSLKATLEYGPLRLIDPDQRPSADSPINPGETVVLKVNEGQSRGYELHVQRENVPEEASYRIQMVIENINFGDGTGFINSGVPYPRDPEAPKPRSRYVRIPVESNDQLLHFQLRARPASVIARQRACRSVMIY